VPTPGGEAVLVVPPGTTGGRTFRLRGQGLPRLMADGTGDLLVTIQIVMPTGFDEWTDEMVRQLERLMPMTPRERLEQYAGGAG
jgi:DnaJ-class molecular chaperone